MTEYKILHAVLSDSTGAQWGALFFLTFSIVLGVLTYGAVIRIVSMGKMNEGRRAGRGAGIALGLIVAIGTFSAFYATSIAGFYDLRVQGDQVVLHYILPERYVTRSAVDLLKVEEEPAFKSNWRLVVHDVNGEVYQSALAGRQDVQQAYALLGPVVEPEAMLHLHRP